MCFSQEAQFAQLPGMNATEAAAAKAASAGVVPRQPMASGGGLGVGGILQKSAAQVNDSSQLEIMFRQSSK